MALEKQTVSINLGDSLDQKDDEKVGTAGSFETLTDWVWNKLKRLDKRPGTVKLPTAVQTDFTSALPIGSSPIPSSIVAHQDQLLMQNKGVLYTYLGNEMKWKYVGHHYPLEVNQSSAVSNQQSTMWPNIGRIGNVSVYAYVEQNQTLSNTGTLIQPTLTQTLKFSVFDELSDAFIVSDVSVETTTSTSAVICYPQVITFASKVYLIWNSSALKIAEVNLSTGALGAVSTLKSDAATTNSSFISDPSRTLAGLDWVYTNKPGVGERAFITYYNTSNEGVVFALKNDGTEDGAIPALTFTATMLRGFGIHYNTTNGKLFIAYQSPVFYRTIVAVCSFTSSTLSVDTNLNCGSNNANIHAFTLCNDPVVAGQVYVVFDVFLTDSLSGSLLFPAELSYAIVNDTTVIQSTIVWGRGLLIAAKAISDTLRNTVYIPCNQKSDLQDTLFLADLRRGKSEVSAFVQAKWSYRDNFSGLSAYCPQTLRSGSNVVTFLTMRKARTNTANTRVSSLAGEDFRFVLDIPRTDINLIPEYTSSTAYLNKGTHFSGGYMGYYDGAKFAEHGFFVDPEYLDAIQPPTNNRLAVATITAGGGGTAQVINATFYGGAAMLPGPAYWTFDSPSVGYYVWYFLTGFGGVDPLVPGKVGIRVDMNGNESAQGIARKTAEAITSQAPDARAVASFGVTTVTNIALGAAGAPTVGTFSLAPTLSVPAGTYQYTAVWAWVDHNGQLMRSNAAVPVTVVATVSQPICVSLYVPPITNRNVSECKLEVYRTLAGQTVFHRITTMQLSPSWDRTSATVSILDVTADATLQKEELLYTTGGILGNFQIPACKSLSLFKNRIIASGTNENEWYYSKTAINNEPTEFSEVLLVATEQDGQRLRGHRQMDDKLIVFKDRKIIYYGGDGANELGQGSTFSQPITISSDVGCQNNNSIEITPSGLYFRSAMGIQLLDRSLQVSYPGIAVKDFNVNTVARAQVLRDDTQVREIRFILSDTPYTVVFDYLIGKWTVFSNYGGTDACLWQGAFARVDSAGLVSVEDKALFTDVGSAVETYNPTLVSQWLKIKNVQDFQRVWRLAILGTLKSPHTLNFKIYYDYDSTNFDSYSFSSSNISGSDPGDTVYQPEIHLKRQKCQAIKVEMTAVPVSGSEECLTLTDMSFVVGVKRGLNKVSSRKKL